MKDFRSLQVWKKAHLLTLAVCRATQDFPNDERFGLTAQLRRASVSIGSNLAEGCGRGSDPAFAQFVSTATGSAWEVEYQLLLAHDLDYIKEPAYRALSDAVVEVKRMLASLVRKLNAER